MHYLPLPGRKVKTCQMPYARMTFIGGSMNYKPSTLKDHENIEMCKRVVREKKNLKMRVNPVYK